MLRRDVFHQAFAGLCLEERRDYDENYYQDNLINPPSTNLRFEDVGKRSTSS